MTFWQNVQTICSYEKHSRVTFIQVKRNAHFLERKVNKKKTTSESLTRFKESWQTSIVYEGNSCSYNIKGHSLGVDSIYEACVYLYKENEYRKKYSMRSYFEKIKIVKMLTRQLMFKL